MDVNKWNPAVLSALRARGHEDKDIAIMSTREAFEEYCTWHGLVNWGSTLWEQAGAFMPLQPAPVQAKAISDAVILVFDGKERVISLEKFLAENADGFGDAEVSGIRKAIAAGQTYAGGGGAAPTWEVRPAGAALSADEMELMQLAYTKILSVAAQALLDLNREVRETLISRGLAAHFGIPMSNGSCEPNTGESLEILGLFSPGAGKAAAAFVERVAGLKKWDEPDENGEPFEPSDGLEDSHSCLMDLIDNARSLVQGAGTRSHGDKREFFAGYFGHEGTILHVEFSVPVGASNAEKDAAFVAALAQQADVSYVCIGEAADII